MIQTETAAAVDAVPCLLIRRERREYRRALFEREPFCFYCGRKLRWKYSTLDHVRPVSRGGTHERDNLVLSCRRCNCGKGNFTALEWLAHVTSACQRLGLVSDQQAANVAVLTAPGPVANSRDGSDGEGCVPLKLRNEG